MWPGVLSTCRGPRLWFPILLLQTASSDRPLALKLTLELFPVQVRSLLPESAPCPVWSVSSPLTVPGLPCVPLIRARGNEAEAHVGCLCESKSCSADGWGVWSSQLGGGCDAVFWLRCWCGPCSAWTRTIRLKEPTGVRLAHFTVTNWKFSSLNWTGYFQNVWNDRELLSGAVCDPVQEMISVNISV